MGPMGKPRQSQVRVNIPHKPTIMVFAYEDFNFLAYFLAVFLISQVKKNVSEKSKMSYEKSVIIHLWGMFTRTWDYRGFPIGPVLTPLGQIFNSRIAFFCQNMKKMFFSIKLPIWPIFMNKCQGKLCKGFFDPNP